MNPAIPTPNRDAAFDADVNKAENTRLDIVE